MRCILHMIAYYIILYYIYYIILYYLFFAIHLVVFAIAKTAQAIDLLQRDVHQSAILAAATFMQSAHHTVQHEIISFNNEVI